MKYIFLSIITLLFCARIFILFTADTSKLYRPDSFEYINLRDNLISTNQYSIDLKPHTFRPPGYPIFLYILAKIHITKAKSIILVQLFLEILNLFLLYTIATIFKLNQNIKLITIIICYASPIMCVYAMSLLSETLFLSLFLSAIIWLNTQTKLGAIALGICMAGMCYTRPIAIFVLGVFLIFCIIKKQNKHLLGLLLSILLLMPWVIRTHNIAGTWSIGTVGDITLYRYHAAALEAKINNQKFSQVQSKFNKQLQKHPQSQALYAARSWKQIIFAHPITYLGIHLQKSFVLFMPIAGDLLNKIGFKIGSIGTLNIINSKGLIAGIIYYIQKTGWPILFLIPFVLYTFATYILIAITAIKFKFKFSDSMQWLCFTSCIILIAITGPDSHPRFRMPITPFMSMLCAQGILIILRKN